MRRGDARLSSKFTKGRRRRRDAFLGVLLFSIFLGSFVWVYFLASWESGPGSLRSPAKEESIDKKESDPARKALHRLEEIEKGFDKWCYVGFGSDVDIADSYTKVDGERIFLPPPEYLASNRDRVSDLLMSSFESYVCSLETTGYKRTFRSADDTVEVHRDFARTVARQITVGKTMRRWMHYLTENAIMPELHGRSRDQQRRYVMTSDDVATWDWLPRNSRYTDTSKPYDTKPFAWLRGDVCERGVGFISPSRNPKVKKVIDRISEMTRRRPIGAQMMLWSMSQMLHLVLRNAPGPDLEARISLIEKRTRTVGSWTAGKENGGITVGIHIRRGDACEVWITDPNKGWKGVPPGKRMSDIGRPCFAARFYTDAASTMVREYGARNLIVLTDSAQVIPKIVAWAETQTPPLAVRFVDARREKYGEENQDPLLWDGSVKKQKYIERRPDLMKESRMDLVAELFAELRLVSQADIFVGTAISWVSKLSFLAIAGSRGGIAPPHILLDKSFACIHLESLFDSVNACTVGCKCDFDVAVENRQRGGDGKYKV